MEAPLVHSHDAREPPAGLIGRRPVNLVNGSPSPPIHDRIAVHADLTALPFDGRSLARQPVRQPAPGCTNRRSCGLGTRGYGQTPAPRPGRTTGSAMPG